MTRTALSTASLLATVALAGVALAADPYNNPGLRFFYPDHDYCFQDHRSIRDIFARRLTDAQCDMGDPDEPCPIAACYDPAKPPSPEMMAQLEASMRGGYQDRFNIGGRWDFSGQGQPLNLTWSFVPDGLTVGSGGPGGAGPSILFSQLDAQFGGNRALWISKFQQCFDRWQALTGINYTRVRSGTSEWDDGAAWGNGGSSTRGDCRISMKNIDGGSGILAYNSYPPGGDMVIDSSDSWNGSSNDYRFLRNVVMHEHGHGIGLAHVCPLGNSAGNWKLMEPFINTAYDGPQQDDIRAAQYNYGDPNEPNATSAQATAGGAFTGASTVVLGNIPSPTPGSAALLSINAGADSDYFSFTVDRPRLFNISLNPVGSTYQDAPQDSSCAGNGTSTNALAIANLAFEIRNGLGTVMRSTNAAAAGANETATSFLVSPAGTFYIRVFSSPAAGEPQAYKLTVTSLATTMAATATDGTFADKVRITWPNVIPDANGFQVLRSTTASTQQASLVATLAAGVFTYDDTTAIPGTNYNYWVKARQPGNDTAYKFMTTAGEPGFRSGGNVLPIADAGPDATYIDSDRNGIESVTLNGSASTDPDGTITQYSWSEGGGTLTFGPAPQQNTSLAVGVHTVTLTVTDNNGATDTDTVVITITDGAPCPADFDGSGGIDGADVEAFFMAWENGDASADVDQSGGVDGGDVQTFFVAWENGGC